MTASPTVERWIFGGIWLKRLLGDKSDGPRFAPGAARASSAPSHLIIPLIFDCRVASQPEESLHFIGRCDPTLAENAGATEIQADA